MIERLVAQGIRDPRVLDAMGQVPREQFVSAALRDRAYADVRLPIGFGQTISRPYTVARQSELLAVGEGEKVLEIGAGSGYQAAVLAAMKVRVFSIERHADLARASAALLKKLGYLGATVKHFDGTYGWAAMAPYDGIIVTAGGPEVPAALVKQLAIGGRLVLPLADASNEQRLTVVKRVSEDQTSLEDHGPASFVPLIGRFGYGEEPSA